jgi:hypothetical protein
LCCTPFDSILRGDGIGGGDGAKRPMPFVVSFVVEALTQPRVQHDVGARRRITCKGLIRVTFGDPRRERCAKQLRHAGVLAFVIDRGGRHRPPTVLREVPIDR